MCRDASREMRSDMNYKLSESRDRSLRGYWMIESADSTDFATEVCPDRRLPSRMTNSRDLVSQEFSERDRARSKYLSVASPRLRSDRALQMSGFSACALFQRQRRRGKGGREGHYSLVNTVRGDVIH